MAAPVEMSCFPESETKVNSQDLNLEVLLGTYEEFVLGYRLTRNAEGGYMFAPSFTNHSHCGSIRCLASCRKFLASGSSDESVHLFNMKTRAEHGFLQHHSGSVTCLEFFKQSHLFSGSEDGNICVWNTHSWTCEKTLRAHQDGVTALSIHPSGKLALSVGKDRSMKTWNLIKGRTAYVTNLKAVGDCIRWSPDGTLYAVAFNTNISVYSVEVAGVVYAINVQKRINDMTFLNDSLLAVAADGPNVEIYHIGKKEKIMEFPAHDKRIKGIASVFFEDEYYIVTASNDGFVKLWRVKVDDNSKDSELVTQINTTCRVTCLTLITTPATQVETEPSGKEKTRGKKPREETTTVQPSAKKRKAGISTASGLFHVEPIATSRGQQDDPSPNGSVKSKKKLNKQS